MRTKWLRALLIVCTGTIGCTSRGSEDAGADLGATGAALGAGSGSLALVRLERVAQPEGNARLALNAKVARYSGLDGSAVLKLLGADVRDSDTCTLLSRWDDFTIGPEARVDLLAVGDLGLRVGEHAQAFAPRLFPDLATTASGWFYAGNAELSAPELDEYVVSAPGEAGVGRFDVAIAAPSDVLALEAQRVSLESEGALARSSDVELTWEPEDLRNRVEFEVHAAGNVLSCVARDDGRFALPQAKLQLLEPDAEGSLVVRRVSVLAADVQGIETAYVRVAATRTLPLAVR